MADLYDTDFYGWLHQQALLLESGQFEALDLTNLTEEVDCMGKRHLHKLESHITLLLMHLLKWQYQPEKRQYGHSWETSIRAHRKQAEVVMTKYPSLHQKVTESFASYYPDAVKQAVIETGLDESRFPACCPWTFYEVMADDFLPHSSSH